MSPKRLTSKAKVHLIYPSAHFESELYYIKVIMKRDTKEILIVILIIIVVFLAIVGVIFYDAIKLSPYA